ncbi:two-component system sensor histidine kinase YesM [Paenibacillus qinlingensis]|uniref:Two-component system sensor histidine kinase YesM n=2 Tax=Paenibacillus qinlingensis TaxID=1837343 RepID=A0ABU1NTZ8_9BACL|nr:two-component system sensor histidine kinase YesM [Paenibacillus qinlingensis]
MKINKSPFVSLRTKFLVLFCLMITLPFLFSGYLTYQKYTANVEREAKTYSDQIVEQISINLERYVKDIERITIAMYYDTNLLEILEKHKIAKSSGSYKSIEEEVKISKLIASSIIDRTELEGVFIFALDGTLFSNLTETINGNWEPNTSSWMEQVKQKDGGLVILPPVEWNYYRNKPKEALSFARLIKDPLTNRDLGYVKVDLTSKGFEKILSTVKVSTHSKLYVFNESLQPIYPFAQEGTLPSFDEIIGTNSSDIITSLRTTGYGGLQIIGTIPKEDLLTDARKLTSFTLWISVGSLIFAFVAALFTSNRLVKPVHHLQRKMRRVQGGDFQERAIVYSNDEIGSLTEGFNNMVSQLDIMIKEMYELRLREKDSELNALQSQINPHFLYNTLESINMVAVKERNNELSQVITSLGKLLRYTVDKQERFVYLKDELAFVQNYLNIQSFRLEDQLSAEILVDFSHEYAMVPKLILQPLVENAIEHGLGKEPITIQITSKAEGQDLYVYVTDNGKGINPERRKLVEQRLIEPERQQSGLLSDKRSKGFALRNIHQRLVILYGESYGLSIAHSGPEGTSFCIHIPFQWEE